MKHLRICSLLIITILLFVQCKSNYEKGEVEFKNNNLDEAKAFYNLVSLADSDYEDAQSRILEIYMPKLLRILIKLYLYIMIIYILTQNLYSP